jgi:PPOX class probable F420-dependent enzyme
VSIIPDSDYGARVRHRLENQKVIWFTTVSADGTPQPNPVWFVWEADADAVLIYNAFDANRLDHVAVRPRVALNFNSDTDGDDIVVIAGVAEQALEVPPATQYDPYVAKYAADVERIGMDAESFAEKYSVPLRVRMTKVRGF